MFGLTAYLKRRSDLFVGLRRPTASERPHQIDTGDQPLSADPGICAAHLKLGGLRGDNVQIVGGTLGI
jgi:hypothetical protein